MFESLQAKFDQVFRHLKGQGRIGEADLQAALKQVRMALLEADVHFKVVKEFVARLRDRAFGADVLDSLTGPQQVVKIVREEMTRLLGGSVEEPRLVGQPAVVMLCGLQGSGKTTTAGKLARRLGEAGRHPLLVPLDLRRAAAVEQLRQVGERVEVPMLAPVAGEGVLDLARRALETARGRGRDVVVADTAGRLHVDDELMAEIRELARVLEPAATLFVADAMTGQDAVRSSEAFSAALPLTGVVLTKLDGDARGGAALSIRAVTGLPIVYAGTGEGPGDLELFHPERMASRILGMGDVLSLIEKAEESFDAEQSRRLAERMARDEFSLEDLRLQLKQLNRLGSLSQIFEMLPRAGPLKGLDPEALDDGRLRRVGAIIDSMTPEERRRPELLDARRKRRIARGSGTAVQEINQLLKQHRTMRKMLKGTRGKWLRRALGRAAPR